MHYASCAFELMEKYDLANASRRVQALVPYLPNDAHILFDAGYLTPKGPV
jgi:hypothetical protein